MAELFLDGQVPTTGRQLTSRLLRMGGLQAELQALAPIALSILLSELQTSDEANDAQSAEYMVVAYIALCRLSTPSSAFVLYVKSTHSLMTPYPKCIIR